MTPKSEGLQLRISELQRDLGRAETKLKRAQSDLITGQGDAEAVTEAQAQVTGLEGAIAQAEQLLQAQLQREAVETQQLRREALRGTMQASAQQAKEHLTEFYDEADRLAASVLGHFAELERLMRLHGDARGRFTAAYISVEDHAEQLLQGLKAEGADLRAVLSPMYAFGPKLPDDLPAPNLPAKSLLQQVLWQTFLNWRAGQRGLEPVRLWIERL